LRRLRAKEGSPQKTQKIEGAEQPCVASIDAAGRVGEPRRRGIGVDDMKPTGWRRALTCRLYAHN